MKTLITILFTAGAIVALLYSEITPWRIVNKTEQKVPMVAPAATPVIVERRVIVPVAVAPSQDHSGDWMHDPNYRSALEKTTVAGAPEPASRRDQGRPIPTPSLSVRITPPPSR
ncbi:MAG: hypothetical protein H0X40_14695 [Chthoniobacterales bacterium]|nr:hypothetical protein [Chthoniobacterales bacterium]